MKQIKYILIIIFLFFLVECTDHNKNSNKKSKNDYYSENDQKLYFWPGSPSDCTLQSYLHLWIEISGKWKIENSIIFKDKVNNFDSVNIILDNILFDGFCKELSQVPHKDGKEYFDKFKNDAISALKLFFIEKNTTLRLNYGVSLTTVITSTFGEIRLDK